MKIYDYECLSCGHLAEYFISPNTDIVCKKCNGSHLNQLVCAPGMVKTNFHDKTGFKPRKLDDATYRLR